MLTAFIQTVYSDKDEVIEKIDIVKLLATPLEPEQLPPFPKGTECPVSGCEPKVVPQVKKPVIVQYTPSNEAVLAIGRRLNADMFGDNHWNALYQLWMRESGWNPNARNSSSGACGIPQALPCSKITDMSPEGQIKWGLGYIKARYQNPTNAWNWFLTHNWY